MCLCHLKKLWSILMKLCVQIVVWQITAVLKQDFANGDTNTKSGIVIWQMKIQDGRYLPRWPSK